MPVRSRLVALLCAAVTWLPARADADTTTTCIDAAEQGQVLRDQRDLVGARKQLLVCAMDQCPAAVRDDCLKWLGEVEAKMPSIVLHARDAGGHDVIDARVLIDGVVVADRLDGAAMPLNPGAHRIRLEARAGGIATEEILVAEGQRQRLVEVIVQQDGQPQAETPSRDTTGSSRPSTTIAVALGAVGVVALGIGTYFEIAGQSSYADLRDGCGLTRACAQDDVDASKRQLHLWAPLGFGVGVASLGVAAAILLFQGRDDAARRASHLDTAIRF